MENFLSKELIILLSCKMMSSFDCILGSEHFVLEMHAFPSLLCNWGYVLCKVR